MKKCAALWSILLSVSTLTANAAELPAASTSAVQSPAARVPASFFAAGRHIDQPLLSPDGKHVIVTQRLLVDDRDVPMLFIYRLADYSIVTRVRLPNAQVPAAYWWVNNTRLIVSIGKEFGSLEQPVRTGEILGMDLDGGHQEYLFGHKMYAASSRGGVTDDDHGFGRVVGVPESRDGRFYLSEHKWDRTSRRTMLYSINANSAVRKLLAEVTTPEASFLVQRDGTPRFAYAADDASDLAILRYSDESKDWMPANTVSNERIIPLAFSADDSAFYAQYRKAAQPYALIRQSTSSAERKFLASDPVGNIDLIEWGPRKTQAVAAATRVGIPRPVYPEPNSPDALLHKDLVSQFPGNYISFSSFSDDGQQLIFNVSSDRDPGNYYLLDRKTMKADHLFSAMEWIDPVRMGARKPIHFKARDGLDLHGYLTLPPDGAGTNLPMILMPHGGPHGVADTWFFDRNAQFLASRGYAVLQINFRGSGGRGERFIGAGWRHWADSMQDDLIDGLRWSIKEGTADASRVCSFGTSYGAYAAMMTAIRAPELIKCAVGYSGLYDLGMIYDEDRTRENKATYAYFKRAIGDDRVALASQSPAGLADRLTLPVLLVHGAEDRITPPAQAKAMRDALTRAGRPPQWLMVEKEGHGFYAEKNRTLFYETLEGFLATNLKK